MEDRDPFFSQKGMYLFASVLSAAIYGMEVREIQVEADVSDGLPSFAMVGFPSAQVREPRKESGLHLRTTGFVCHQKK